ncbi:MAG TPA: FMN-binding protein [Trebonia sp.]
MRRAVLTLGGTVAGIAALLSFKTHPATLSASATPAAPSSAGTSAGGTAGTQAGSATPKQSTGKQSGSKQSGTKQSGTKQSSGGTTQTTRTIAGAVENTQYGPMQVEVTLAGKRITDVKVLQETNDGSTSQQIDSMSIPKLNSETLAAQSAQIDAVSGASYTSQGYKQSLQSALDKA